MSDEEKLDAIENLPDNCEHTGATMGQREGTVSVTNDHSLDDVKRDNDFAATSHQLAKEKTKRRCKPLLVLLLALLMAALGGVAALTVYKHILRNPRQCQLAPQRRLLSRRQRRSLRQQAY